MQSRCIHSRQYKLESSIPSIFHTNKSIDESGNGLRLLFVLGAHISGDPVLLGAAALRDIGRVPAESEGDALNACTVSLLPSLVQVYKKEL